MSLRAFEALACKLARTLAVDEQQSINRTQTEPISVANKLQMCLRWLAGGSCHGIRAYSGVSTSAFYESVHSVIDAILDHPDLQLRFPTDEQSQRAAARLFAAKSNCGALRGCVAAIDGWLCPIRTPRSDEVTKVRSLFSGYYQCFGVNVQACCDVRSRFMAIACSSAGGTGEAIAYIKWGLADYVEALPCGLFVVGDNAYTNSSTLLTPFPRPRMPQSSMTATTFI